nr:10929_t:CDS:2 [Entrophospora candida]
MLISNEYFKENESWTLIGYLRYRVNREDFLANRNNEHLSYRKNLDYIANYYNTKQRAKAKKCIDNLKAEKNSPAVNSFWASVVRKKYEHKIEISKSALCAVNKESKNIRSNVSEETMSILREGCQSNFTTTTERKKQKKNDSEEQENNSIGDAAGNNLDDDGINIVLTDYKLSSLDDPYDLSHDNILDLSNGLCDQQDFDLKDLDPIFNALNIESAREEWSSLIIKMFSKFPQYKDEKYLNLKYALDVIHVFLLEFENGSQYINDRTINESMYNGTFIDPILGGAIRSSNVLKGEIYLQSTIERKNINQNFFLDTMDNGHKADGIIYWKSSKLYELGILEVSYGPWNKSVVKDSSDLYKLKREMKDCLNYVICKETALGRGDFYEDDIMIIGVHSSGFVINVYTMKLIHGAYIINLFGTFEIPTEFSEFSFLKHALAVCLGIRDSLVKTVRVLNRKVKPFAERSNNNMQKLMDFVTITNSTPVSQSKIKKFH